MSKVPERNGGVVARFRFGELDRFPWEIEGERGAPLGKKKKQLEKHVDSNERHKARKKRKQQGKI